MPRRGVLPLAVASFILSLVACVLAVVAVVSGGVSSSPGTDRDPLPVQGKPTTMSAAELESTGHVTLPPGTVLLSAVTTNGLDTRLAAKFRMPRTAQEDFLKQAGFTAPLQPGLRAVTANDNVGGGTIWDPQKPKTVTGLTEQPAQDGLSRKLMLDLDTPETTTAYFYATRA